MEYITKKVPRRISPIIRELAARRSITTGHKVSEAEIIREAITDMAAREGMATGSHSLLSLAGFIKGGPRTNATKEIDEVVYGDID